MITLGEVIGIGSFGSVSRGYDKYGKHYAVKTIETKKFPEGCLIEPFIMSSIRHPYIMSAQSATLSKDSLVILQDLAFCNLSEWRETNNPDDITLKIWAYQVLLALDYLHRCHIIHGDIKSHNILVMNDGTLKLCDFTFSSKDDWKNTYQVYTYTHRPPEVWKEEVWNRKVDVWGYGCFLYEFLTGKTLMPIIPKDGRKDTYLSIFQNIRGYLPLDPNIPIEALILRTLQVDPLVRPTVGELLNDDFFDDIRNLFDSQQYPESLESISHEILFEVVNRIISLEDRPYLNEIVRLASHIYDCVKGIRVSLFLLNETCVYIAAKLILRPKVSKINIRGFRVLEDKLISTEIMICNHLRFRLPIIGY